jgi:N-acetylglucosaminyl-diphospho-decaprenol L-rhamnosyltransferase
VRASVVLPSLRGGEPLLRLVRGLVDAEVLVADNGLERSVADALLDAGAQVLSMGANLGFGAAVNRAARAASGDALVVLNDDVEVTGGFLERLVAPVERAEMVAGVLLRAEARDVIDTAGVVVDAALGPYDYLAGEPVSRLDEDLPPPLGPCGGAAAFRRDAFLSVGGFDEGFFAYGEDVDLALRLRAAGANCALAADARAVHLGSATLGYASLEKAKVVGYSRGYLLRKYGVLRRPAPAARAVAAELATSILLARRHRSLAPLRERVRGYRACRTRASWPDEGAITVRFRHGLRSRYRRGNRPL